MSAMAPAPSTQRKRNACPQALLPGPERRRHTVLKPDRSDLKTIINEGLKSPRWLAIDQCHTSTFGMFSAPERWVDRTPLGDQVFDAADIECCERLLDEPR